LFALGEHELESGWSHFVSGTLSSCEGAIVEGAVEAVSDLATLLEVITKGLLSS